MPIAIAIIITGFTTFLSYPIILGIFSKQRKLIGVFLDKPLIDKWGYRSNQSK